MKIYKLTQNHPTFKFLLLMSGLFLVPLLTSFIAVQEGLITSNFTSLATQQGKNLIFVGWFILTLSTLSILLSLYFHFFPISFNLPFYPFPILVFTSAVLPYDNGTSLFGFLHVFIAYVAFFYLHLLLLLSLPSLEATLPKKCSFIEFSYFLSLAICLGASIYGGSINFLVEAIYLSSFSIILSLSYLFAK